MFIFYKPKTIIKTSRVTAKNHRIHTKDVNEKARLTSFANSLKPYLTAHQYCRDYCFLIDMKIHSGKNRFFVYSLKGDSVLEAGTVTHGSGSLTATDSLRFSNIVRSNASSLGKYKIGNEYSGRFGPAFKLYGLEATNSNAFARSVVLHAHPLVPQREVWPEKICTSWGCPTVSPEYFVILKKYIDEADKPVVLWIFY